MRNIVTILFLLIACNKKQPACNSEQVKAMVLSIYEKDLQKHLASQEERIIKLARNLIPIESDSIAASFLRNGSLKIENVMTTEKKEDVFACECKGDLNYQLSVDFVSAFNQKAILAGKEDLTLDPSLLKVNFESDITYKAQLTDDKEKIGVEALTNEDLRYAVEQFIVWYVADKILDRKIKEGN